MNDETREAMYLASITNRLTKDKVVTQTIQEPYTLEEVKAVMLDKSPTCLYVLPWSAKKPHYHITKRILPSQNRVTTYQSTIHGRNSIEP